MVVAFVGDVDPQASAVREVLLEHYRSGVFAEQILDFTSLPLHESFAETTVFRRYDIELLVVAGYRRLIPPNILRIPRHGTVGFHSAKLPEYPGRAPVPWTLLRGDDYAYNTMFYLDDGVDSGDIIDQERYWIRPGDQPEDLYRWIAESDVRLLRKHLPGLLAGTAPRTPQDPAKRGPLTTADGWARHASLPRYTP